MRPTQAVDHPPTGGSTEVSSEEGPPNCRRLLSLKPKEPPHPLCCKQEVTKGKAKSIIRLPSYAMLRYSYFSKSVSLTGY